MVVTWQFSGARPRAFQPAGRPGPDATSGVGVTAQAEMGGRAARGAATVVSAQISRIALQTVGIIVLARLLSPTDYGLIAMVMVVISFADTFRDFGFSAAAIQASTLSREQRSNLFWANTGIGVVLTLIVSASAGLVAAAFHEPLLVPLVVAMSSLFTINGLATEFRASLSRSLRFAAVAWPEVIAQGVGLALAIAAALTGWQYWALVLMQVSQALLVLIMSYVLAGWVPGLPSGAWRWRACIGSGSSWWEARSSTSPATTSIPSCWGGSSMLRSSVCTTVRTDSS